MRSQAFPPVYARVCAGFEVSVVVAAGGTTWCKQLATRASIFVFLSRLCRQSLGFHIPHACASVAPYNISSVPPVVVLPFCVFLCVKSSLWSSFGGEINACDYESANGHLHSS